MPTLSIFLDASQGRVLKLVFAYIVMISPGTRDHFMLDAVRSIGINTW